jgi:Anti-sigma factor NepR
MMRANGGGYGLESSSGPGGRGPRPPSPREPRRAIDEARLRQQAIGAKLRQMFDQVVNEPIPQEFLDILRRGDEASSDPDED